MNSQTTLHAAVTKYVAIGWVHAKEHLAHRAEIIMMVLKNAFVLAVSYQLFTATYQSQGISSFAGLTIAQIIWMLVIMRLFRTASRTTGIIREIMNDVKSGNIAYSLNRPLSYLLYRGSAFWGAQIPVLVGNLLVGAPLALLWVGPIKTTAPAILGTVWLIIGGITMEFFFQMSVGLLAFWLEDVMAIGAVTGMFRLVFSGTIIPLALYPQWIQTIAFYTPFSHTFYTAGLVFVTHDQQVLYQSILVQAGWLIILGGLTTLIFKRGIRNVIINGG